MNTPNEENNPENNQIDNNDPAAPEPSKSSLSIKQSASFQNSGKPNITSPNPDIKLKSEEKGSYHYSKYDILKCNKFSEFIVESSQIKYNVYNSNINPSNLKYLLRVALFNNEKEEKVILFELSKDPYINYFNEVSEEFFKTNFDINSPINSIYKSIIDNRGNINVDMKFNNIDNEEESNEVEFHFIFEENKNLINVSIILQKRNKKFLDIDKEKDRKIINNEILAIKKHYTEEINDLETKRKLMEKKIAELNEELRKENEEKIQEILELKMNYEDRVNKMLKDLTIYKNTY